MGEEKNEGMPEAFAIENDSVAEWALGKIKEATEERDRLLSLVREKEDELAAKKTEIERKYDQDTGYLKICLQRYMGTVPCKVTKTQETYQLLSGKLIRKLPTTEYAVDKEKLLTWLKANKRDDLVKTEESPRWGDLKKLVTGDPNTGLVTIEDTGELVEGVEAKLSEPKFDIKLG